MPEPQSNHLLVDTPLLRVFDVTCRAPRSGCGAMEYNAVAQIALPRRGVFVLERRGETSVIDATTVVRLGCGDEYRIAHPADGGDAGTIVILPVALLEEATGGLDGRVARIDARDQLSVRMLTRLLREGVDALEAEDAAFLAVSRLSRAFAAQHERRSVRTGARDRVERVRAALASDPATRWDLRALGRLVGTSPFHLARQFRAATGETITQYLLRLRLALAIDRLADGASDIAAVALDAGFASHSHFSARFHRVFGVTPQQARAMCTSRGLRQLRRTVGTLN